MAATAALALAACGTDSTELIDDDGLPGLESLTISPGTSRIDLDDLGESHVIDFVATGHFHDGVTRDVTTEIAWSTDRADAGAFAAPGRWTGTNRSGGRSTIAARSGAVIATAQIEIFVRLVVIDPVAPPPPDAPGWFDPPTPVVTGDPMRSPGVLYPANEAMVPLGLYRATFQLELGTVVDVLRLHFVGPYLDLTVFTAGETWQPDAVTWDLLARTSAGDHAVLTLAGVDTADPTTVWEARRPLDLYVSASEIPGAIYYWSTATEGVMRASPGQAAAERFYTAPPDTTCVGCHTVSRDGRRIAVGYNGEVLQEASVPDRATIVPADRAAGWSTFSPDGRRLLIANKGTLTLLDADTGAPVGADGGVVPIAGATHPDWSPLGDAVAVAQCGHADDNRSVEACSIVRIPYAADAWGAPEPVVMAMGPMDSNYFPRYSPDGSWIAYVHATGKSKDQPTAELRLVAAGGGAPITLARANHRVGPSDGVNGIANTMPVWAPATGRGTQWLAFASARDYGAVPVGPAQLWAVALDLSHTGDPSYAAVWLPFQAPAERNHRAVWALDPDQPCAGGDEICDGFDNDCDGVVDDDCTPCDADAGCVE